MEVDAPKVLCRKAGRDKVMSHSFTGLPQGFQIAFALSSASSRPSFTLIPY